MHHHQYGLLHWNASQRERIQRGMNLIDQIGTYLNKNVIVNTQDLYQKTFRILDLGNNLLPSSNAFLIFRNGLPYLQEDHIIFAYRHHMQGNTRNFMQNQPNLMQKRKSIIAFFCQNILRTNDFQNAVRDDPNQNTICQICTRKYPIHIHQVSYTDLNNGGVVVRDAGICCTNSIRSIHSLVHLSYFKREP